VAFGKAKASWLVIDDELKLSVGEVLDALDVGHVEALISMAMRGRIEGELDAPFAQCELSGGTAP
jgi:hypothetical protein